MATSIKNCIYTDQKNYPQKNWNIKSLIFVHLFVIFLLSTWYLPLTRTAWNLIDQQVFFLLNASLKHSFWQNFWALANHKKTDWLHDVFMLLFFFFYIKKALGKKEKVQRASELIASILFFALTIFTINKTLVPNFFHLSRSSPSITYEGAIRLSQILDWLAIKDYSRCCFPADHGTTASLFVGTIYLLMGRKAGFIALLYGIFFCLPRLVVGAHFTTDILIGSVPIALIALGWAYLSPFFFHFTSIIAKIMHRALKLKRGNSNHEKFT